MEKITAVFATFIALLLGIFAIIIYKNNNIEKLKIALSWINSWVRFFLFLLLKVFTFMLTYGIIIMVIIWLFSKEEGMYMV